MCEMAYQGEYDPGDEYSRVIKEQCMCVYTDDVVSTLLEMCIRVSKED